MSHLKRDPSRRKYQAFFLKKCFLPFLFAWQNSAELFYRRMIMRDQEKNLDGFEDSKANRPLPKGNIFHDLGQTLDHFFYDLGP